MNVNVYLIVIVLENNELYVLLKDNHLPTAYLKDFNSSFDAVEYITKESMNITGKWLEVQTKIAGVLDEINRKDSRGERLVSIVYHTCLPAKNSLNNPYRWVDLKTLESIKITEEEKNIIQYTSISI